MSRPGRVPTTGIARDHVAGAQLLARRCVPSQSARRRDARALRIQTGSTPEQHLNVRLAEWIKGYDLWVSEKAKPGESDPEFVARHERKRVILETDWKVCTDDTVDALREIGYLSDELQSINSEAMPSEEWNKYKHLMDDKKMIIEVIDTDMPKDPYVIDRLRDVASKLEQIVNVIDKRGADINSLLQKYGP